MSRPRYPYHLAIFMIAYYVTNCMYQSFMSLFYTSVGFSSARIGLINAGVALVSIAAQPLWGTVGDRTRSRGLLIALLAVASAASVYAFRWFTDFAPLLLLSCLFSCFYTSLQPMGDSIILRVLDERDQPFGPIRMSGGVAFAVFGIIFGRLLNAPGRDRLIPVYTAALCLGVAAATLSLPHTAGSQSAGGRRMHFSALFRHRELMKLLLFLAPIQVTMGYFYTFFSPHFMSLPNANSALLGVCYFVAAMSEVPFLLMSDKLFDRYGTGRLMCVSAATLALRWLLVGLGGSVYVALASQLLHGWGFIVMTVCMAKYISRSVPPELQASGQMLLAIFTFGIARAFGNLAGGLLAGWIGRQSVFFICSAVCALTLLFGGKRVAGQSGSHPSP